MAGQHSVFINYRRDDAADATGRIYDRLVREFTAQAIFKDVDALPVGEDFGNHIVKTLRECRVLLAIIGPHWLELRNETGQRRLDDPADWVRLEIEHAARMEDLQVVPVLINGAPMPSATDLPDSLRFITNLNAAIVRRDPDFHSDMGRLIDALKQGALTGMVEVEVPTSGPGAAAAHWQLLQHSFDIADLRRFAETFPGTTEALEARRRSDFLQEEAQALARINWSDLSTAEDFLRNWPNSTQRDRIARRLDQERKDAAKRTQAQSERAATEQRAQVAAEARRAEEDARHHQELLRVQQRLEREAADQRAREIDLTNRKQADASKRRAIANFFRTFFSASTGAAVAVLAVSILGMVRGDMFVWQVFLDHPGEPPFDFSQRLGLMTWFVIAFTSFYIFWKRFGNSNVLLGIFAVLSGAIAFPAVILNWSDIFPPANQDLAIPNVDQPQSPAPSGDATAPAEDAGVVDAVPPASLQNENHAATTPTGFEFVGNWTGTISQFDRRQSTQFAVRAQLSSREEDGSFWGEVDYPTLSCTANWSGDPPVEGQTQWSIVESATHPCDERVYVDLILLPEGQMTVTYRRRLNGPVIATGTLTRQSVSP